MNTLADKMKEFREKERLYDFSGMAQCLLDSKDSLYHEESRSGDGQFFLDKFLNVFVLAALQAVMQHDGEKALCYLRAADEVVWKIYGKELVILHSYKGFAYQELRLYDDAEKEYLAYLAYEPQDETIFLRLGNMAFHQERWDNALEAYGHALRIKKNYREAMINIGILARKLGDEDTAKAMAMDEDLRKCIFEDGVIEENPGRYSLSIDDADYLDIPIFINARDRLEFLRRQVNWLLEAGYKKLYILDNASTYPPLLDYYKTLDSRVAVLFLKKNLGYKALWKSGILNVLDIQTPYVYTDPDIVPVEDCPKDFLRTMLCELRKYPYIKKIGFGLKTDDITFEDKESVIISENKRMMTRLAKDLFFGVVDTTFALYRNYRHYNAYATIRTGGKYMARHLPWYLDYEHLSAEEAYYADQATDEYSTLKCLKDHRKMCTEEFVHITSIIILSYNTLSCTQLCIESIREYTSEGSYEIIVVDNGSTDGSAEWLREQKDIRCIFNKDNRGFPGGCNQGLEIARGDDLLLLNSDTIVTPHWLDNLQKALHSNSKVGAVGCVTNYCSNEQRVNMEYQSLEEMIGKAELFNQSDSAKWYPWLMLVGFCMMFRREVYEKLGGLDEAFSPGNYEDDDYSIRIRLAGWELLLCEDTFIHHFGSVSFSKKKDNETQCEKEEQNRKLLQRNRKYLLEKWKLSDEFRDGHEMVVSMAAEIGQGHNVLIVNCGMGQDLYWLHRKFNGLHLYGLTDSKVGADAASVTFPVYVCENFKEGVEQYYASKVFDRIVLLGNSRQRSDGERLIAFLRSRLTEDGILYFGDAEHVYRMPAHD